MAAPNLKEIEWAIQELQQEESSKANYIFMASLLRCRDEFLGKAEQPQIASYSQDAGQVYEPATLGLYGDSEFLRAVYGKDPESAWEIVDDLMDTLRAVNPRVYDSVMRKMRQA